MSKSTHTWKIGEYCKGGIITANINGKDITLLLKEWDYSKGSRRSSDQTNAKVIETERMHADSVSVQRDLADVLCDWTTSFYADEIIKWIETKVNLYKSLFW